MEKENNIIIKRIIIKRTRWCDIWHLTFDIRWCDIYLVCWSHCWYFNYMKTKCVFVFSLNHCCDVLKFNLTMWVNNFLKWLDPPSLLHNLAHTCMTLTVSNINISTFILHSYVCYTYRNVRSPCSKPLSFKLIEFSLRWPPR